MIYAAADAIAMPGFSLTVTKHSEHRTDDDDDDDDGVGLDSIEYRGGSCAQIASRDGGGGGCAVDKR